MKHTLAIAAIAALLSACTTAGPYVTNISANGDGSLQVEKCSVQMNAFMGTVSNHDCRNHRITLSH